MLSDFAINERILLSHAFQKSSIAVFLGYLHNHAYPSGDWVIGGGGHNVQAVGSGPSRQWAEADSNRNVLPHHPSDPVSSVGAMSLTRTAFPPSDLPQWRRGCQGTGMINKKKRSSEE